MKKHIYLLLLILIILCNQKNINQSDLIALIKVEPCDFMMGNNDGRDNEKPMHKVGISKTYYLSRYKITNSQVEKIFNWGLVNNKIIINKDHVYTKEKTTIFRLYPDYIMAMIKNMNNKLVILNGKDEYPCVGLNWYGAVTFCNLLSEYEHKDIVYDTKNWEADFNKKGYRLPTEAEWEFAARGGNKSKVFLYAGSNDVDEVAWYNQTSPQKAGLKKPNELGFYDMSGNLYEWCNDWYKEDYYKISPGTDPKGPVPGKDVTYNFGEEFKVRRSCVWSEYSYKMRITSRIYGWIGCTSICGLRVAINE